LEELTHRQSSLEKNYRQIAEWTEEWKTIHEEWILFDKTWRMLLKREEQWNLEKDRKQNAIQLQLRTDKKALITRQLQEQIHLFDEVVQQHELETKQLQQLDEELEKLRGIVKDMSEVQTAMQRMETFQKKYDELQSVYRSEQQVWNQMEETSRAVRETEDRLFHQAEEDRRKKKVQEDLVELGRNIKVQLNRFWGCVSLFLIGLGLLPLLELAGWLLAGTGAMAAGWSGLRIYILAQERSRIFRWSGQASASDESLNKSKKLDEEKRALYASWVEEIELEDMEEAYKELKEIQKRELERLDQEIQHIHKQLEELCRSFSVQHPRELFSIYRKAKDDELQYQYLLKQKGDGIKRVKESASKLEQQGGIDARRRWERDLILIRQAKGSLWDPQYEAEAGVTGELPSSFNEEDWIDDHADPWFQQGERIRLEKENASERREWLLQRKAQLESSIETLQSEELGLSDMISLIDAAGAQCEMLKEEFEAMELAETALREVSEHSRRRVTRQLAKLSSEMISSLTDRKYDDIRVDVMQDFNISVMEPEMHEMKSIEQLSRGTVDQFYLSMRVALNHVFSQKVCLPLFLDDASAF
jgi:hypothetical protein